jgi:ferredoxin-NADP reductase
MNALASTTLTHTIQLRARETLAHGTMAFHFDKPAGFAFRPGQAIELLLPGVDGAAETGHAFSLASAPFEDTLVIATRMRDTPYKRALARLPLGASVGFEGPFGSMTLHRDAARPAILVAGGIGITPFIGMLRVAAREGFNRDIVLVYSNPRPEDAAFLPELLEMAGKHARFRLVATMTDMANSTQAWSGEKRIVDAALIRHAAGSLPAPIHYVAGPPAMVVAMRAALALAGVDEDDIRSEDFHGY